MPTETIIRRATPDDLPTLGGLGALLVRTHHAFDPKRFIDAPPHTEAGYALYLGEQLGEPNAVVLVAVHDDRVIGYAYAGLEGFDYMSLRGPAGALYDIVVDPAHRGGRRPDAARRYAGAQSARRATRRALDGRAERVGATTVRERGFRRTMVEMTRELDDV